MIQHVVIAVIFFFIGIAWGWGMHGMMVANARRKRIFEARQDNKPISDPENKQSYRLERSYGVIVADAAGKLYLKKFDA
jgi:cellobiose-specific phosphotransferase system component IIC